MADIEIQNLCYRIDEKESIENVSFTVPDGELFTLCGPSGAGKTTILRLIIGELTPDSGDILIDGVSVLSRSMREREAVLVAQDNRLFPHMTLYENVAFGLSARKIHKKEIQDRITQLSQLFHLEDHLRHYPDELSGGQQKLAAIMRAIAVEPKVLLLDEPFSGLDNSLHHEIRSYLLELQKIRKFTVITISHSKEDAFFMGHRIGFLFDGKLRLVSKASDLCSPTEDSIVDSFIGKIRMLSEGQFVFEDKILTT